MLGRKVIYSVLVILFTLALILSVIVFYSQNKNITVNFLDVGQGDAILISKGSKQIIIDGGPNRQKILEKLGEYIPFWDRKIEVILATHPDKDHIEGLIAVMNNYKIGKVIDNGMSADTEVFKNYEKTIEEEKISRETAKAGMDIVVGDKLELNLLNPRENGINDNSADSNSKSIVTKIKAGDNSFLFTGDISYDQEKRLINNGSDMEAAYLKVSHHGSKYATSQDFLDYVKPREAVISVGSNNRYGHPSSDVIGRLEENGIKILRTDRLGDIRYECSVNDGVCSLTY